MIAMLTNHDHAMDCLRKAEQAHEDSRFVDETYWLARAQVYATLALANSYADSR